MTMPKVKDPAWTCPIPDEKLRDSYVQAGRKYGCWREKLLASTTVVEEIIHNCGPEYQAIRFREEVDKIRSYMLTCCKNPEKHGGGWGVSGRRNGMQKKGEIRKVREKLGLTEYEKRLQVRGSEWRDLAQQCYARDGWRCRLCGCPEGLQAHHLSYDRFGLPGELEDLTTLCDSCHEVVTKHILPWSPNRDGLA